MPKKVKHRKLQRGRVRGMANARNAVSFGTFGIKSLEPCWVTAQQIEAARKVISRYLQKTGKFWIRIFPDKPITIKGNERLGGGKGAVDHYAAVVKPGMMLFEIDGVAEDKAKEILIMAGYKLPVKIKFVKA